MIPQGEQVAGYNTHQDLVPTMLQLLGVKPGIQFDGRSLLPMVRGDRVSHSADFYITEATWMRKHGWRTPEWKLIVALEPDFHFKPEVELYNLIEDPGETKNLANRERDVVAMLKTRMEKWIAKRERETGNRNPMFTNLDWHGKTGHGPFKSSQEAYDTMYIGSPKRAQQLQAGEKRRASSGKRRA